MKRTSKTLASAGYGILWRYDGGIGSIDKTSVSDHIPFPSAGRKRWRMCQHSYSEETKQPPQGGDGCLEPCVGGAVSVPRRRRSYCRNGRRGLPGSIRRYNKVSGRGDSRMRVGCMSRIHVNGSRSRSVLGEPIRRSGVRRNRSRRSLGKNRRGGGSGRSCGRAAESCAHARPVFPVVGR